MTKRVDYIDKLKGFAIILVVMGHILEWGMGISDSPANLFYSSFHMPLFMFLSGLFAMKSFKTFSCTECINFLKNKVCRIVIPFLIVGGVFSILQSGGVKAVYMGEISGYWFLPALFYAMVTEMIVECIIYQLHGHKHWLVDVTVHLFVFGLLSIGYYNTALADIPYYLHFIKMYPFFVFGIWFMRYESLRVMLLSSRSLLSCAVISFLFCIWLQQTVKLPIKLTGFFAIIVLMNLFAAYGCRLHNLLSVVGKYSLQIYVFHWFIIPSLLPIGAWLLQQGAPLSGLPNENIVLMLLLALLIALPIVGACMIMGKIVKHSYWLNIFLFGGK